MIDYLQNHRIEALERALAALTNGNGAGFASPLPNNLPAQRSSADAQQSMRIDNLESSVLALTNSVTLLNQQIANLTSELQRQTNMANMININPSNNVDHTQDVRLDGIDTMVQTLTRDVSEYNQQMVELISQFNSLGQRDDDDSDTHGSRAQSARASWL